MGWSHGRTWSDERARAELSVAVERFGRMPSRNELADNAMESLANYLTRNGGMAAWAERVGARLKWTETHRGQAVQRAVAVELLEMGFDVKEQTARAPFDLLVDGVRVDVKSAKYSEYRNSHTGTYVRGHVFALNKVPATCDLYLCCGVDESNAIMWRYYIPAEHARVRTLTITPTGKKYTRFREAIDELRALSRK